MAQVLRGRYLSTRLGASQEDAVGELEQPSLAEFARYLPRVGLICLSDQELRSIPVHAEPPPQDEFLSLGELPPGAPPLAPSQFRFVGTRQLYVYHAQVPPHLWHRLATGLQVPRPSGSGGTGMFGNADEQAVDEEDPAQSWRVLNAGEAYRPPEL
ncbi:MAG: hypothetical protein ACRDIY_16180 [Chloroflexota bacterium]